MNERIKELALQAGLGNHLWLGIPDSEDVQVTEKFAELIVKECIHKMLNSDDEHFMKLEGWELGGANHGAWERGILDAVATVKEHFGVEE